MAEHGERVTILGSGNVGTMFAYLASQKIRDLAHYQHKIKWWVFEEILDGEKLSDIINTKHENVKYCPGIILPTLVEACTNLEEAVEHATIVVFAIPPQYVRRLLPTIRSKLQPNVKILNVMRGVSFDAEKKTFITYSEIFNNDLNLRISVLGGAFDIENLVENQHCEATIGCKKYDTGSVFKELFETSDFKLSIVEDVAGVELCGVMNSVIALGAGVIDALDVPATTKAAAVRLGFLEMIEFCKRFYPQITPAVFYESCGIGDCMAQSYGGRNRRCAEVFARTKKPWSEIESTLLSGQKLHGSVVTKQVNDILGKNQAVQDFPFLDAVFRVCFNGENSEIMASL